MAKKWYGNVHNRVDEGHNYTGRELSIGDDITMYHWSDRTCYYITDVIDQKHIKVKQYHVCADHSKTGGMGHQDWLYFKNAKDMGDYLRQFNPNFEYYAEDIEEPEQTWAFRNGKWKQEFVLTDNRNCTPSQLKSLEKHGYYKAYCDLSGNISFGVRDYYYDWEF